MTIEGGTDAGWFRTDVSGLHIGPIFKSQDVQEEATWAV
jgi:hypothetical protein